MISSPLSRRSRHSWARTPSLRTGLLIGAGLSLVFVAWLFIANRIPALEDFALIRNAVAGSLMMILMILPVITYVRFPGRLLTSGLSAWTLFALCYRLMEQFFELLESRVGAFHLFMLGAVLYLGAAVLSWITLVCLSTRHSGTRVHHGKIH
ncbi:MAG TPA: hypothetical protein VOA41_15435 [Candidatus Dormibacteraeota bacterium]|nr:hypothetical protein [Candidatus Dormibacteraeota bacterium]